MTSPRSKEMGGHWETEAENWLRWARTPGHDAYWTYAPAFFDEVVPAPGRRTLEVGCGEGRVVRDLARRGHRVVALDLSPTLIRSAKEADPAGAYVQANASALPFPDGSFDLVVAYNSLIDVEDMLAAVGEAARVLVGGGRLCVCVTHPVNDAGTFEGEEPAAPFVIAGSYLGRRRFEATFERDGLRMTFQGWACALEDYSGALEAAGLLIELIREPQADQGLAQERPRYRRWQRLPMFLHFRAVKP